ncbi:MAG TPA: phosphodiester glycosidase family protein [Chitinophagaceae bacterium]|nr:phosphodiester glycosidase family protein [Chitinophagaceae bacterium]
MSRYGYRIFTSFIKVSFFFAVYFFNQVKLHAQSDSAIVVNAKWEVIEVAHGITLKHYWFDSSLFGSSQNISILEVKLNAENRIDLAYDPKKLKPTSEFAQEKNAVAAMNGTFFNMKDGGSEDYIRAGGKTINETLPAARGKRSFHQQAAITIDHNKIKIVRWDSTAGWEDHLRGKDIMVSGPLLIYRGKMLDWPAKAGFFGRNPRSVLAIRKHTLFLVAVDGRNDKAAGMTIDELTLLMHWLKMDNAINLDGGGSTTLWVKNYPYGGVVNHPSDNHQWLHSDAYKPGMDLDNLPADTKRWDHNGERPVANAILIERR